MTLDDSLLPAVVLRASLDVALRPVRSPLVLAVSGGRDSMALMHAIARWAPDRLAAVATFDHGTGDYATEAASLVAASARRLGLTVVRERAREPARSEAAWRDARWKFLRRVARAFDAQVVTAHTRDDQVETVVMRLLRGAGARGLASLAAPSAIVRPWLSVSRAEVAAWVAQESLPFAEDPMNASLTFQRGRVRHELLPAFEAARPGFSADMVALGEQAAAWRRDLDAFVTTLDVERVRDGVLRFSVEPFDATTDDGRAVLWPACFAQLGVVLDARGTHELSRFSTVRRRGAHVTLAGGAVVLRVGSGVREWFELRRPVANLSQVWSWSGGAGQLPSRLGAWRFHRLSAVAARADPNDQAVFGLPVDTQVVVRNWHAGDRIQTLGAPAGRRVTRYFSDAHVPVLDRAGWPVVLVGDALLCVPGICRSLAAPYRPGWPDSIWYRCEREPNGQ